MKKFNFILLIFATILLLCGCGKSGEEDIIKKLAKRINDANAYHLTGTFELVNNEETYTYDISVDYKEKENFKVNLINKTNNHEQVIIRNEDGVYVLTPSLNKSFKFQSDWPYNNSQTYILQTLIKDIENDSEKEFKKVDDGYIITTNVNYSNKQDLVKQNIYLNKEYDITKVEVYNSNNQPKIIMNFSTIDYNSKFNDDNFDVNKSAINSTETQLPVSSIDSIIFPMYVPTDTYLTSQDIVSIEGGQRAILTFNGEKPFTVIQETITKDNSLSMSIEGEPYMIMDTVGAVSDSYVSWISNGIEYHVISDDLTQEELINVANSISVMPVSK